MLTLLHVILVCSLTYFVTSTLEGDKILMLCFQLIDLRKDRTLFHCVAPMTKRLRNASLTLHLAQRLMDFLFYIS